MNKVLLEYIPKYGQTLSDEVKKWGQWVKIEAEKELAEFYPKDPDGATPVAYLWARTITCEGPGCGAEVPLIRSCWLAKKSNRSIALKIIPNPVEKRVNFEIIDDAKPDIVKDGIVKRGSATCPCCGYTTPITSVRKQLIDRHGGADDARMFCVVITKPGQQGRFYRVPTERDTNAVYRAKEELERKKREWDGNLSLIPDEKISLNEIRRISVPLYGMSTWGDIFTNRQALAISTFVYSVNSVKKFHKTNDENQITALKTCLAFSVDRCANQFTSLSKWNAGRETIDGIFSRQAIPMLWDFGEINPLSGEGYWINAINWITQIIENLPLNSVGRAEIVSAAAHTFQDDSADALITDPPYYDAVPYAYLSDFFYVWLRRSLINEYPELLSSVATPKKDEIVVDRPHRLSESEKGITFYQQELTKAFAEGRRILKPNGIGTIVFASKSTSSWEAILEAVVSARWTITASWPIDTELETRVAAQDQARLLSSIHLVCRPRENIDGTSHEEIGDWREVLQELPIRIHEWMPRLAEEGVVGADAIFACLGPALEIYSRYSRVEKPNGEQVLLREYLEKVWAAVAQEALKVIFHDADTSGFEEDARLTAMWLWTLSAGVEENGGKEEPEDDEEKGTGKKKVTGFTLEYDAARKIAQGLGAHPEEMRTLVEVKGDTARLLPVSERAQYLFGKSGVKTPVVAKKRGKQMTLGESTGDDIEEAVAAAKSSMD
ncbi:MAG: DUF1156 domain-containing protein, partial [Methanomicrobiales archaeon]